MATANQILLLTLFTIAYLAIDITYVLLSNKTYGAYAKRISGAPISLSKIWPVAILAYITLAIGWLFVCIPLARTYIKNNNLPPWAAGAAAGALYGFVLYGTFNFTIGSMFEAWNTPIIIRDVAWGTISLSVVTGVAMNYIK